MAGLNLGRRPDTSLPKDCDRVALPREWLSAEPRKSHAPGKHAPVDCRDNPGNEAVAQFWMRLPAACLSYTNKNNNSNNNNSGTLPFKNVHLPFKNVHLPFKNVHLPFIV